MKNYYKVLEVAESATQDEIKKSFRKLSMKWHPDKNKEAGALEKFHAVAEAYDVLGDEEKRKKYDEELKNGPVKGKTNKEQTQEKTTKRPSAPRDFSKFNSNDFFDSFMNDFDSKKVDKDKSKEMNDKMNDAFSNFMFGNKKK